MNALRLTLAAMTVTAALAAAPAHAGYRYGGDGYDAVCRYEAAARGYGPTFAHIIVYRCYPVGVVYEGYRHRGHIVRARG